MHNNQPDNAVKDSIYIFSYFKGHGDGLHLAWSEDGYRWEPIQDKPLLFPQIGIEKIMRDPFLYVDANGTFHAVWTCGWFERGIGYSSTNDLLHWSEQRFIPVMEHEPLARNCWAPEIVYDYENDLHVIVWATTIPGRFSETDHAGDDGLNHRMYFATTRDFKSFGETQLFFDGGFNVIDATIVRDGNRYVMFMKDETLSPCQKNIRMAISESGLFSFSKPGKPLTGDYWAEGPTAIKIDGRWTVYFDKYKLNQIGAVASDDLINWRDISSEVHFPPGAQHGSVMEINRDRLAHLLG